ncbi:recombinase family protein [Streptomyces sp. NPDC018967]|uniref:recombinase family protein n=1 Tax=Streptomyces sp. NPDC018967 TaxID=3365059 RepID=UPI00379D85D7
MKATSTWSIAPELAEAMSLGVSPEEWIGGRLPVCSYARISEDGQEGADSGRQHLNNDVAARGQGMIVVARYTDNHLTAADPAVRRPAFLRMIQDLRARRTAEGVPVVGIIAAAVDRVYRLPVDRQRTHRALTLDDQGCFFSVDEQRHVTFSVQPPSEEPAPAENDEVAGIRRRTARSVRDRAREGKQSGGHRRFGWFAGDKALGRPHNHELDPVESAYVRKMIDMILSGQSSETVSAWLNDERVPTVRGGRWTGNTVRNMVSNPAICGYRMLDGELVRDPVTGAPVVGDWETVADPAEWRRLTALYPGYYRVDSATLKGDPARGTKRRSRNPDASRKYLLSGILLCGKADADGRICGSKMVGNPPSKPNGHPAYACKLPSCRGVARRVDLVDQAVEEYALRLLADRYGAVPPTARSWHGQATLDALLERKRQLKQRYVEGVVAPADFFEMLPELDAQIIESQRDKDAFEEEERAGNALAGVSGERWREWDLPQKRAAILRVIRSVVVKPLPEGRATHAPFDPSLLEFVNL